MGDTLSLFDIPDSPGQLFEGKSEQPGQLDVVHMDFIEAESLSWQELFSGFDRLYAITYSSGIGFIYALLKKFLYAEVIFGCEDVMSFNLQEVMAYQIKMIERLRTTSGKAGVDLISRIDEQTLRMFVARQKLSHEKIYLLEAEDGRKRVVMGSANMSYAAFSGQQRENICYLDGDKAYEWYKNSFEALKDKSSDNISRAALSIADDGEHLNEIPVFQTVKVKKAMVIEPTNDVKDEVRFSLDVKHLAGKLGSYVPKQDKKGKIVLSPENVLQTRKRVVEANIKEKELRSEYPQLVIDIELARVTMNDLTLDLNPAADEITNDVGLFVEYMEGYEKFHGDVTGMQSKYYAFANWFFTSPFMASMRNVAVKYNQNLLPYPVFGLVYGKSKAGKTSFLETLLKMMIGQKTKIAAPDFTRSSIDGLKRTVKGAPIIVDDLTQTRFNQHAIETIKNDDFGVAENILDYPAVVISANEDVKAVAPEVTRRTVLCHVQAGLKNTEIMKTSIVRRVQKNIGTAFYREYLRRMLMVLPDLIDNLKEDESEAAPDILEVSSQTIYEIISEHFSGELPHYIRRLTLDDYFSEKVTGSQVIKTIRTAWDINKSAFEVNKKQAQLRYNAGQYWEADRIMKELPEDLEAHKSREWIVMDLDAAGKFFNIDFRKPGSIWGFFNR